MIVHLLVVIQIYNLFSGFLLFNSYYHSKCRMNHLYFYKNGLPDGINAIEAAVQNTGTWYNLWGQRQSGDAASLPKGVYIHNGKKILVK